jgi:peptidyl-prolyl cis-trans isomerase SurA
MTIMTRAALALALLGGTATARPPDGARAIIDLPVAIVGGSPVWKSEVDDMRRAAKAGTDPEITQKIIDELIEQHLMLQAADEAGITATDAEIDAAIADIMSQNHITDAQLDTALADAGLDRAKYRAELAHQVKLEKWMQLTLASKLAVHASENTEEFSRGLDAARRAWIEEREQIVHIERRQ